MGVSYSKHQQRRAIPWPRYRVGWWGELSLCWHDEPKVHTTYKAALARALALEARGDKVRVCIITNRAKSRT